MRGENASPIYGPLSVLFLSNLILVKGHTARCFQNGYWLVGFEWRQAHSRGWDWNNFTVWWKAWGLGDTFSLIVISWDDCYAVCSLITCFLSSDTADHSATAHPEREILAVGSDDGQLWEEVSWRFWTTSAVLGACQLCLQVWEFMRCLELARRVIIYIPCGGVLNIYVCITSVFLAACCTRTFLSLSARLFLVNIINISLFIHDLV